LPSSEEGKRKQFPSLYNRVISLSCLDVGGRMFLRNLGVRLQDYTVSHRRRRQPELTKLLEARHFIIPAAYVTPSAAVCAAPGCKVGNRLGRTSALSGNDFKHSPNMSVHLGPA
jgi:hypothetical protein